MVRLRPVNKGAAALGLFAIFLLGQKHMLRIWLVQGVNFLDL
jgi:hypothetical protein